MEDDNENFEANEISDTAADIATEESQQASRSSIENMTETKEEPPHSTEEAIRTEKPTSLISRAEKKRLSARMDAKFGNRPSASDMYARDLIDWNPDDAIGGDDYSAFQNAKQENRREISERLNKRISTKMRPSKTDLELRGIVPPGAFDESIDAQEDNRMKKQHKRKASAKIGQLLQHRVTADELTERGIYIDEEQAATKRDSRAAIARRISVTLTTRPALGQDPDFDRIINSGYIGPSGFHFSGQGNDTPPSQSKEDEPGPDDDLKRLKGMLANWDNVDMAKLRMTLMNLSADYLPMREELSRCQDELAETRAEAAAEKDRRVELERDVEMATTQVKLMQKQIEELTRERDAFLESANQTQVETARDVEEEVSHDDVNKLQMALNDAVASKMKLLESTSREIGRLNETVSVLLKLGRVDRETVDRLVGSS